MAKKKKLQAIARPFATSSMPKKVIPPPALEDDEKAVETEAPPSSAPGQETGFTSEKRSVQPPVSAVASDAEKAAEQVLQNLVEKLQEKTEREINRTFKAIEFDRRVAKSLPRLDFDPILRNRVLKLVREEKAQTDDASSFPLLNEAPDKVLIRSGVTYGVLVRMGFSEERVNECLKASSTFELDEAFNWLYLHCPEEELDFDQAEVPDIREPRTPSAHTPKTPISLQASNTLDAHHLTAGVPSSPSPLGRKTSYQSTNSGSLSSESSSEVKSHVLETYNPPLQAEPSSRPESPSSDSLDMDPNVEYARVKLRLFQISCTPSPAPDLVATKALEEKRLEGLRQHYFFREKDAELEYHAQKNALNASALDARLRDPNAPPTPFTPPKSNSRKRRPPSLLPSTSLPCTPVTKSNGGLLDDDSANSETSEGIFGTMLDEMPASEIVAGTNTVVRIRDMSLPKHWAGRTPRVVLTETVYKMDKYAAVSFFPVGGASRACRAGVNIRWGGGKSQEWCMEDEGCYDDRQAEQFISTVALHALTFITQPGFANATVTGGAQTYFRVLPPVYRDLWDELEIKRKSGEDAINRRIWGMLRDIVEPRLGSSLKVVPKVVKSVPIHAEPHPQSPSNQREQGSDQIASSFRARQETLAYQEMLVQRNTLPIAAYRDEITRTLDTSQVMVLSGETGCGKSTQVPSFILEEQLSRGNHCKIFCTEPRRISAISLAQRVSRELGDAPNAVGTNASLVGYSIRLESNTTRNTRLAFVTNGIALRMLEGGSGSGGKGIAFDEITHIIIDEVHERSIESDFLLIVLKSLIEQRKDLKVILMSATLDAVKISQFFGNCPVLHVPGRTFPVDVRFLEDAIEFTQWSIKEGSPYAKHVNDRFHRNGKQPVLEWTEDSALQDDEDDGSDPTTVVPKFEKRYSQTTGNTINLLDERLIPYDLIMKLLERICFHDIQYIPYSGAVLIFMPGMNEIRRLHETLSEHELFGSSDAFRIYPLHSTISSENQGAVFDLPPPGVRKIVIATNIAETGITIPDITCVIDSGKHREMRFDEKRQISRLVETYIARSNAAQRRGRAGRVQAGLCFHLFTKFRHDSLLAEHPLPEMMRLSLSDLALRIKILKVNIGTSIEDVLSRALDPPAQINVQRAVSALVEVKALTPTEDITPMGRLLSKLPTDVHLGKFLLIAALFGCLDPALTIAAALNSKSPFLAPFGFEQEADRAKTSFKVDNSDFLTIHAAFASWRRASANPGFVRTFCRKNYLSHQNLQQIEELRQQFLGYLIDSSFIHVDKAYERELSRTRYGRNRTRFVAVPESLNRNAGEDNFVKAALVAGLYPKVLAVDQQSGQLRTLTNNQPAAFHPSSVNFQRRPKDFGANHLCYFTIMHSKKLYAWETGPVDDLAMFLLCGDADFKLSSNSAVLDRKIKFATTPKTNLALKILRDRLGTVLGTQMRGKPLSAELQKWNDLALLVLGKIKVEAAEEDEQLTVAQPPHIDLIY
ncbi:hypothetical protein BS47DRAFT_1330374 [Hydnum rufescens UP504]|uniref:RNA helicase n=1 Tax=Hydnum rufescens UP504 TaxID=1448309 RepID=A0A9P6AUT9_9AGAM|nr:hypothetical protein BS47DRAFT_1330374 [Hydnum rufescens UP504]